jgi:hypothetical protein
VAASATFVRMFAGAMSRETMLARNARRYSRQAMSATATHAAVTNRLA